eukprot:CAMPEP_0173085036 /NCGR_PEP_ID=MMETSP1102-20130122/21181_1 /TAXON_ID=49646 /ORGANISM="Geminigera sp., Strain Caron Lab Isolate" /LENGTH=70 /DNA_ID=CAMNT_0013963835 /DNA_START=283 /DNA_END=495 /DNA_ORIENTATION=-
MTHVQPRDPTHHAKNIQGPAPPICPFGVGINLVQNISARPFWSGGNQQIYNVEEQSQYHLILCGGSDPGV